MYAYYSLFCLQFSQYNYCFFYYQTFWLHHVCISFLFSYPKVAWKKLVSNKVDYCTLSYFYIHCFLVHFFLCIKNISSFRINQKTYKNNQRKDCHGVNNFLRTRTAFRFVSYSLQYLTNFLNLLNFSVLDFIGYAYNDDNKHQQVNLEKVSGTIISKRQVKIDSVDLFHCSILHLYTVKFTKLNHNIIK